jgi:hypothetical protein
MYTSKLFHKVGASWANFDDKSFFNALSACNDSMIFGQAVIRFLGARKFVYPSFHRFTPPIKDRSPRRFFVLCCRHAKHLDPRGYIALLMTGGSWLFIS